MWSRLYDPSWPAAHHSSCNNPPFATRRKKNKKKTQPPASTWECHDGPTDPVPATARWDCHDGFLHRNPDPEPADDSAVVVTRGDCCGVAEGSGFVVVSSNPNDYSE